MVERIRSSSNNQTSTGHSRQTAPQRWTQLTLPCPPHPPHFPASENPPRPHFSGHAQGIPPERVHGVAGRGQPTPAGGSGGGGRGRPRAHSSQAGRLRRGRGCGQGEPGRPSGLACSRQTIINQQNVLCCGGNINGLHHSFHRQHGSINLSCFCRSEA